MKFDLIIGNPPYSGSLHLKILNSLLSFAKEIVWISPIRWIEDPLAKYKKSTDFQRYKNTILKHIEDIDIMKGADACKCFNEKKTNSSKNRDLNFSMNLGIYHVLPEEECKYEHSALYRHAWFLDKLILGIGRGLDTLGKHWISRHKFVYEKPFVRMSHIHGSAWQNTKYEIMSKNREVAFDPTRKNVGGFNFETQTEAVNFFDYMQTDFVKMIGICTKVNQDLPWGFIPYMNDYTRPWTDEDLFQLFDITEEEQKIIHDTVKEISK